MNGIGDLIAQSMIVMLMLFLFAGIAIGGVVFAVIPAWWPTIKAAIHASTS